ncbi:TPA: catalase-peroxidase, partial [Escherichia coli]
FINLLDMSTRWEESTKGSDIFKGYDRKTNQPKWNATSVDLIFGANPELRAVAEVYASDDAKDKFINDFIKVWTKIMNLDRFDMK